MSTTKKLSRSDKYQKQSFFKKIFIFICPLLGIAFLIYIISSLFSSKSGNFELTDSYDTIQNANVSHTDTIIYSNDGTSQSIEANTSIIIEAYYEANLENQEVMLAQFSMDGQTYYIQTTDIELIQENTINDYIANQLGYPHDEIEDEIAEIFEQSNYKTESGNPIGIVIHDTGVDYSTIDSEVNYMVENYTSDGVFVHAFIDNDTILRIADEDYEAQGAGANANPYYIQFELTHEYTLESFATQLANAAYYTAFMLKQYHLPVTIGQEDGTGTVWTHEMVSTYLGGTDHIDPTDYWTSTATKLFGTDYSVEDFSDLVQAYYNAL